MIANAAPSTPISSPNTSHPSHRTHRVRGLSFLHRRPRGATPSPPVSPQEQNTLERSTSFPLPNNRKPPGEQIQPSTADSANPVTTPPATTTSSTATTTSPATPASVAESSSMARLRRAFSSQNGVQPQQVTSVPASSSPPSSSGPMHLTAPVHVPPAPEDKSNQTVGTPDGRAPTNGESTYAGRDGLAPDQMPTIKFIPHQDPRSSKPSLGFAATSRTLPHEDCVIRVGRYSERDGFANPPLGVPSAAPIGFKSKVVSRKHCEFWCSQGQWYIKDVKSSSGTFLNHIRLSQPNTESRPFPINDGDVVQLGIDFKGGEEAIFRCVKIRIECNRNWQKKLNDFNMSTHKRLRELNKPGAATDGNTQSSECAICLMSIAPCQSLFVAPCSHVWHFKCIRPMLNDHKTYPQFMCPNCRAVTDLEADVEDVAAEWDDEVDSDPQEEVSQTAAETLSAPPVPSAAELPSMNADATRLASGMQVLELGDTSIDATLHSNGQPAEMYGLSTPSGTRAPRAPSPSSNHLGSPAEAELAGNEGPLTPRNNAGPFVFDGSAGRSAGARALEPIPQIQPINLSQVTSPTAESN